MSLEQVKFPVRPPHINLGCGIAPEDGFINHDRIKHSDWVDVAHDLDVMPWPWPDNYAYRIVAKSVLEHLKWTLIESVNECWRILEPGGYLYVKVPAWNHRVSFQDPTHRWYFSDRVFEYFDPETELGRTYFYYTPFKWKIIKGPERNKIGSSINVTMQKLKAVKQDA